MGISQNPVGSHGTPGENVTAFPRLPRRFAPRNDTSGEREVHQCPPAVELLPTGRSLSAATVKFGSDRVRRHSVYIGSAFPRLPRARSALAMTNLRTLHR